MGIFDRGLDIQKNHLRIEFDLETKKYITYHGQNIVQYNELNKKSKKVIDQKNKYLMDNPFLLEDEIRKEKTKLRFNELKRMGYPCNSFEYLGQNTGTMSKEMENYLMPLVNEDNVLLGIHRVGENINEEIINDVLTNGLLITGHLGGATESTKSLNQNVSYYPDNKTIIKELMYADAYKNSKGSFLIKIPDEDLKENIYIVDGNNNTRLNPKYILGYVPLLPNHQIEKIITKKRFNNSYIYDGEHREISQTKQKNTITK